MIKRALLSVSDKTGLADFARFLQARGVEILSTGGTSRTLKEEGIAVTDVADVTGFPEIMDGRVKTLHPMIHGGILAVRKQDSHRKAMDEHGIKGIDLVVINLYPFEETVKKGANYEDTVEQIDIGGPAMVRAAAKNHTDVTVVVDPGDYIAVQEAIEMNNGDTSHELRKELALKAFSRTASYDSAIAHWLARQQEVRFPERYTTAFTLQSVLRYGENPHQQAAIYASDPCPGTLAGAMQRQGKELSYNNINDTDAAWQLACEFDEPAVAIIKHANPCGVAVGSDCVSAYHRALACDPVSAFGGIIALNRPLTAAFVTSMDKLFVEVIIAPEADEQALELLSRKKNLRLLTTGGALLLRQPDYTIRSISGGLLVQEYDHGKVQREELKPVTEAKPSEQQLNDLLFAFRVCKHVKSNAIVLAKDGATVGIGAGQMSRVDSVRVACWKAAEAGLSTHGTVLASDAFFPFDDNVHRAAEAGVVALIQPGGSIRDEEVIAAANQHNMAMVFAGIRHFRH